MSLRLLILVCSCLCWRRDASVPPDPFIPARRRQGCRDTWLREVPEGMRYVFLVGAGDDGRCVVPVGEGDVWALPVSDSYDGLPEKIRAAFRRALSLTDWDYLFKCDDDTYCDLGRLRGLLMAQDGSPSLTSWAGQLASGGAGYLLPRALVQAVVRDPLFNKQGVAHEDKQVTWSVRRAGGGQVRDARLQHYMGVVPSPGNVVISCHTCSPQDMRRIDAALHAGEVAKGREVLAKGQAGGRVTGGGLAEDAALPFRLRPQGHVRLPAARVAATPRGGRLRSGGVGGCRHAWPAPVCMPGGVKRVVLLSNVTQGFSPAQIPLRAGDLVLHCNRARHREGAMAVPGTRHWLFVRHGRGNGPLGWHWYHPECFEGFERVVFVDDASFLRPFCWYRQFRRVTGKSPTTGFVVANSMREIFPDVPLLLAGFDPGHAHGTPRWNGHDWQAEADWYRARGFRLLPPGVVPGVESGVESGVASGVVSEIE